MKSLYTYISKPTIDGHVHAFDHKSCLDSLMLTKQCVGFADIDLYHPDEYKDMVSLYKRNMDKCKYVKYWLAAGLDIDSIKKVYNEVDGIAGFGELKLYDDPRKTPKNHKSIDFLRKVLKFSNEVGNLPVYIHYELNTTKDVEKLENVIKDYPEVPIVHCHLGMNKWSHEFAFGEVVKLSHNYGNYYMDISWSGAKWLVKNPLLITQLPVERCIWGSDQSPKLNKMIEDGKSKDFTKAELETEMETITKYINSDHTIKRLFNDTAI